jgi:aryl carrier-like protein
MLGSYQQILAESLGEPDLPVSRLPGFAAWAGPPVGGPPSAADRESWPGQAARRPASVIGAVRLAAIAAEVLGTGAIGDEDNLFGRGADSLLIARLVRRVQEESGQRLMLRAVLREPTLAAIAALLGASARPGLARSTERATAPGPPGEADPS